MTSATNTLRLDFRDNPDLKAALGGLQPGDSTTLEFELTVKANDDETFEATVEGITYDSETEETTDSDESTDSDGDDSKTVKPSAEEPVMVVMLAKNSKAKSAKGDAEEDVE